MDAKVGEALREEVRELRRRHFLRGHGELAPRQRAASGMPEGQTSRGGIAVWRSAIAKSAQGGAAGAAAGEIDQFEWARIGREHNYQACGPGATNVAAQRP